MKLASQAFFDPAEDETPHIEIERLEAHGGGLIALTGGPDGPIDKALARGAEGGGLRAPEGAGEDLRDRLYVEIQRTASSTRSRSSRHCSISPTPPRTADRRHQRGVFRLPRRTTRRTTRCCVSPKAPTYRGQAPPPVAEHFFKTAEQMAELFADLPEALANTIEIAKRCAFPAQGAQADPAPLRARRAGDERGRSAGAGDGRAARPGRGRPEAAPRHDATGARLQRGRLRQEARLRDRRSSPR